MRPIRKLSLVIFILPDAFLVQKATKNWTWPIVNLNCSITLRPCRSSRDPWAPSWDGGGYDYWWCSDSRRDGSSFAWKKSRTHRDVQNISWPAVVLDIIWETMIDQLKQFVMSSNFVFVLITVGFIIVVALLLLENRRTISRQLNAKIKDLIAGTIQKWSTCKEVQSWQIWPIASMICRGYSPDAWKLGTRNQAFDQYPFLTDGVLATNRRGQIISGQWNGSQQLNVNPTRFSIPVF